MIVLSILFKRNKKTSRKKLEQFCTDAEIFIQVHYVREKSSGKYAFNTLKLKTDPDREECKNWYAGHGNPDNFQETAGLYMKESNISMEDILQDYGRSFPFFNGMKGIFMYGKTGGKKAIVLQNVFHGNIGFFHI